MKPIENVMTKYRLVWILIISLGVVANANAQSNFNALPWKMNTAYFNYLMRDVHQQYADRKTTIEEAFKSEQSMLEYRDNCILKYKNILGEFPEKEDLNAQVLGVSQQNGFRIEKIVFESIPKRYVTANLYIPDGNGPFPVAVELCGHGMGGKIPAPRAALLLVQNQIAVLVVDPVGQGERVQFVDENSKSMTRGSTTGHTLLNAGANLVGTSVAAAEYWDNHRAIDYLVTHSDIDADRIGVFGSSGGGTQTSYLMGLDDRIKVASVCSYFSQRERVLEMYDPSDGCQHVPYEGREQLEIADFVLMMAPRPVLIMSGRYDFVDYWGATQAFAELEKTYTAFGSPEKVKLFSIEGGHGMPKPKREALASWFRQWMYNDSTPVVEKNTVSIPAEALQCTETGQVNTAIRDKISFPEYHLNLAKKYEKQRAAFLNQDRAVIEAKVIELLGISVQKSKISSEPTGFGNSRNYEIHKYQITRLGQMPVPCVLLVPENVNSNSQVVLILNEGGKNNFLEDQNTIDSYINQNQILLVADLRGFGETADPSGLNDTKYWNREYRNAMISMHIGKPIVGQRVIDVFSLLDFIENSEVTKNKEVILKANGAYGSVAVHAAFLDPRISKTEISGAVKSYFEFLENPMQHNVYSQVLYGVLKYYDLKDLVQIAGKNRIRFVD
ncbi:acetylxylan esterase [Prolixibacteraceae bacterium Z1-6]|uniref:Acetylxylan esterase n=1 Tax=Draconibacterium aestuarii TaxID=2998507 RepID=A0A9X3F7I2_9BACT|nr:acetylxylan esterase [Prolixibacteraceae bacterium Z1-6]